jgi:diacylglycerol kinase family enzyme
MEVVKLLGDLKKNPPEHLKSSNVTYDDKIQTFIAKPTTSNPVFIEADGELSGKLPATFKVIQNSLKIIVPKSFRD